MDEDFGRLRWSIAGDRTVCMAHIDDEALRRELADSVYSPTCSFCGRTGTADEPIAADLGVVAELVLDAVESEYGTASDEGVPRDEGEWALPTDNTYEVVEATCAFLVDYEVVEAIEQVIEPEDWIRRDWGWLSDGERLAHNWESFAETLKHRVRFWFLPILERDDSNEFDLDHLTTTQFFASLERVIRDHALSTIPAGTTFMRGRIVNDEAKPDDYAAKDLGPAPEDAATANRMSPAGIPMFYGSDSVATVAAEIGGHGTNSHAIIGRFTTTREMTIADLSALPEVPSVFDKANRASRGEIAFLRKFAVELSRPIPADGREHIEYVPTQVFTEYLRHVAVLQPFGLTFRSSQIMGLNTVLFCTNEACVDASLPANDPVREKAWLELDNKSVEKVRVVSTVAGA